jgi:hypothetical protein
MKAVRLRNSAAVPLLFASLCACGQNEIEPQRKSAAQEMRETDEALFKDIGLAGRELERRLLMRISAQDGIVTVREPDLGYLYSHYLPATSPWVLTCGITGMSIVLGSSVSGDGTSVGNDVEVRLAYATLDEKACAVLGPQLAKRLRAILEPQKAG